MEHFDAISRSPSQIYHSALPLCPSSSWLHNYYTTELSKEVKVVLGLPAKWGACFRTVVAHSTPYCSISWKNTIAVGLCSGDITILSGTTGSQVATLSGHTDSVHSLAVSLDGALFVSGSGDETIKQWDLQTGGVIKTLYGHTRAIFSVSISADHATIASISNDNTLRLWDIQTGECHHIMERLNAQYVSFSPTDSQCLMCVSYSNVKLWEIGGHHHTYYGCYATFSPDGTQFASYHRSSGTITIWNSGSRAIVTKFTTPHCTDHFCFSPNGTLIAVTASRVIQIWDITSSDPQLIETLVGHTDTIESAVFSSPYSLISTSDDGSVKFWEITVPSIDQAAAHPKSTSLSSAPTRSITLQAEHGIAILIHWNGEVKVCDLSTGICKASFQTPIEDVKMFDAQLIDSRLIFIWFADEKLHVYDIEKEELLYAWCVAMPYYRDIRISGDGSKVLCLDLLHIQAWSIKTGEKVGEVRHSMLGVDSIIVDGSRAWVQLGNGEITGWDSGVTDLTPVAIPDLPSLSFDHTKQWDIHLSRIRDTVTGHMIFVMGGRYRKPLDVQLSGKYVAACYRSGEILVLDFNHVLS